MSVAENSRRLVAASYNVHACIGRDGRRDPARIAAVVRELEADVVGLQEVHSTSESSVPALEMLAASTGFQAIPGPTYRHTRGHFGNALLTRRPVRAIRQVDLSVPKREPRGAIDVELDWDGLCLRVVITHLGLRAAERRAQVMLLLGELHLDRERLTLLLGDFNEWLPGGRPLRALQARFGHDRSPATFPSWRPILALDRIWVQPRQSLGNVRVHASPLARAASDHLPIVGTVLRP